MKSNGLQRTIALVVDDHPETLRLLIDALEEALVTVLVATDGKSALEQVEHLQPDLILLDAVMPGMDGFETCRALKGGAAADVPVIFMTGLDDTEHIVRGLESGGIDYITKPIVPDELLARMRVHLASARSVHGARAALDASGRTLLAVGTLGEIKWATPEALRLLARLAGSDEEAAGQQSRAPEPIPSAAVKLPAEIRDWVIRSEVNLAAAPGESIVSGSPRTRVRFRLLSRINEQELLLVVQQADPDKAERRGISRLQRRFALTVREADVLYWLSRGKSNRDIADILGMSHRTVDKHLEHAYPKMGVESRAAAVAAAVRVLED
jgi:DNA-binding response OmpR family regulator/DNA-binding CsgD family transcriptional regulator